MPRIIETNPDGSSIPNYLTQSARGRPFQAGRILEIGGVAYGFSGAVSFDVSASATYPLLDFQLERPALFKVNFSALYKHAQSYNASYGYRISIDSVDVWNFSSDTSGGRNGGPDASDVELVIPANKPVSIKLLNPDASSASIEATCVMVGRYI